MRHATASPTRLKIPRPNVRVVTQYMGGGFGSKLGADVQVVIAARLARAAGAPVKIMLDRKHEHLITGNRPSAFAKVKAGVSAEGRFVAWDAETWGTGGAGAGAGFSLPVRGRTTGRRGARAIATSTSTPGRGARSALPAIRRRASSPKP